MTLGMTPKDTQAIIKALQSRDSSITSMDAATPDKQTLVTVKVTDETGKAYDITLAYAGKQTAALAALNNLELAQKLGLPTEAKGVYQHPVKVGEEITFYASSKNQAAWFSGKSQHVFITSAAESYEAPSQDEEAMHEAWLKEINTRLADTKTIAELESVYDQIVQENEHGEIVLDAEALETIKAKAISNLKTYKGDKE